MFRSVPLRFVGYILPTAGHDVLICQGSVHVETLACQIPVGNNSGRMVLSVAALVEPSLASARLSLRKQVTAR
jgi:hypothetical protein